MPRMLCEHCQRPLNACICAFTAQINNTTPVIVLQHPSEVSQSKGTAVLLSKSLSYCQVIIGEDFSKNEQLEHIIANHQTLLLYPSEQATEITFAKHYLKASRREENKPLCLIILDGTWKKAYRMFMLSKNLQQLKQVCLPRKLAESGQYLIRKVAKKNALSSLEATCYALALLEGEFKNEELEGKNADSPINCGIYQPLLNKFIAFNQFQLSFRPEKR